MNTIKLFFALSFFTVVWSAPMVLDLDLEEKETESVNTSIGSLEPNQDLREIRTEFEKALGEYLKADDSMRVLFWPTPAEDMLQGKFSRIDIRFRGGRMQGIEDLAVRRGHVSVRDLQFDLETLRSQKKLVIKSVGDMGFRMRVEEDDLNSFLEASQRRLNLQYPKVELKDGKMFFVAKVRTLFFNSKVRTEGSFQVNREQQTVDFRASNVSLNSLPVPGFVVGNLLSRINPVLKLKKFPLVEQIQIELDEIKIQQGFIELSGS
ncbi:MAG: DUF2993 domain-containing protein [Candidatus Cloacimonetes bacterium]|nr:DUF2993 domain-containing protein [Candidatus Cloacimonadota bacterium]